MLSLLKNSFFCLVVICFTISCNNASGVKAIQTSDSTTKIVSTPSFTILQYGELPPPLYFNAIEIIGKHYNILFRDIAGCVVSEKLVDSILQCNTTTYSELKKIFKRDVKDEIDNAITIEYAYLNELDSILRKAKEIETEKELKNELIYYSRNNKIYAANFIVREPGDKVLTFKLKLVATVDSSTKQISGITKKDSLIKQFSDLQL